MQFGSNIGAGNDSPQGPRKSKQKGERMRTKKNPNFKKKITEKKTKKETQKNNCPRP